MAKEQRPASAEIADLWVQRPGDDNDLPWDTLHATETCCGGGGGENGSGWRHQVKDSNMPSWFDHQREHGGYPLCPVAEEKARG